MTQSNLAEEVVSNESQENNLKEILTSDLIESANRERIMIPVEEITGIEFNNAQTGEPICLPGYAEPGVSTPDFIETYSYRKDILLSFIAAYYMKKPLMFVGPSDSGKTSLFNQIAAGLNWDVLQVSSSDETEVVDLQGNRFIDSDGTTPYGYGSLLLGFKYGIPVIWDEIDKMREGVLAKFNSLMEGYPFSVDNNGGEMVRQHENFYLMATSNTKGFGDTTGMMNAARAQDQATMRRFFIEHVGYLDRNDEDKLLTDICTDEPTREAMLNFAGLVRGGTLPVPFGTSALQDVARLTDMLADDRKAVKMVLLNRLEEDSHIEFVCNQFMTTFGYELLGDD